MKMQVLVQWNDNSLLRTFGKRPQLVIRRPSLFKNSLLDPAFN